MKEPVCKEVTTQASCAFWVSIQPHATSGFRLAPRRHHGLRCPAGLPRSRFLWRSRAAWWMVNLSSSHSRDCLAIRFAGVMSRISQSTAWSVGRYLLPISTALLFRRAAKTLQRVYTELHERCSPRVKARRGDGIDDTPPHFPSAELLAKQVACQHHREQDARKYNARRYRYRTRP